MLRAIGVSFAVLVVSLGLGAAQESPSPFDVKGVAKQPSPHFNLAAGSLPDEDSAAEQELLDAAKKSREQAGVPPLRMEESLQRAAREHARGMAASKSLEHQLPGEPVLLERIALAISQGSAGQDNAAQGDALQGDAMQDNAMQDNALQGDVMNDNALKLDRAGENIANASCALSANDVLMRSAPHRKNLLDRGFNVAGFAAIWSGGRLYVVQDFGHEVPSYSAQESRKLVGQAVGETRQQAGLRELAQVEPPRLDEAACSLAKENRPNAHLLAASYGNRRVIAYTQSRPEVLPPGALRLLRDPSVRQYAVGSCYARNAAYPTGMYWIAILLY
jgi:uncharacterized protein YkwD